MSTGGHLKNVKVKDWPPNKVQWVFAAKWQGKMPHHKSDLWSHPIVLDGARVARFWKLVIYNNYGAKTTSLLNIRFYGLENYFKKSYNEDDHKAPTTLQKSEAKSVSELKRIFASMDKDNRGSVDFMEFQAYMSLHTAHFAALLACESGSLTFNEIQKLAPAAVLGFQAGDASATATQEASSSGVSQSDQRNWDQWDETSGRNDGRNGHLGGIRYDRCVHCHAGPEEHVLLDHDARKQTGMHFFQWLLFKSENGFCRPHKAYMTQDQQKEYLHSREPKMETGPHPSDPSQPDWSPRYCPLSSNKVAWSLCRAAAVDLAHIGRDIRFPHGFLPVPFPTEEQALDAKKDTTKNPELVFVDEEVWKHVDCLIPAIVWSAMDCPEITLDDMNWTPKPVLTGRDVALFCRPKNAHMDIIMKFITDHHAKFGSLINYHVIYVPGRYIDEDQADYFDDLWSRNPAYHNIQHHDFEHGLCPVSKDVMSMTQPNLLREVSLENMSPLDWVANSVVALEKLLGEGETLYAKGDLSEATVNRILEQRERKRVGGKALSKVEQIILIDSSLDHYVSSFMTQRSYQGVVEEIVPGELDPRDEMTEYAKIDPGKNPDEPEGGWPEDDPFIFQLDSRDNVFEELKVLTVSQARNHAMERIIETQEFREYVTSGDNPKIPDWFIKRYPTETKLFGNKGFNAAKNAIARVPAVSALIKQLLEPSQHRHEQYLAHYRLLSWVVDTHRGQEYKFSTDCKLAELFTSQEPQEVRIQDGSDHKMVLVYILTGTEMMKIEDQIALGTFAGDSQLVLNYILDMGILKEGLEKVISLLCLFSATSHGWTEDEILKAEEALSTNFGFNAATGLLRCTCPCTLDRCIIFLSIFFANVGRFSE